jgi:long-chain acyl-CoA synthetase
MNLAALLFDVARRLPERLAVSDDRNTWTYRELATRIAVIAGGLRAYGLVPGDRVLLALENCGEFFELLFGCWAAGLCAVPANARLHPHEVEFIAENSGARLPVATPALAEALALLTTTVSGLARVITTPSRDYEALLGAGDPVTPEPGVRPSRLAVLHLGDDGTAEERCADPPQSAVHEPVLLRHTDQLDEHVLAAPVSQGVGLYALPFLLRGAHQIVLPYFEVAAIFDILRRQPLVSMFAAPTMLTQLVHAPEVRTPIWAICARSTMAAARCMSPIWSSRWRFSGRASISFMVRASRR